MSKSEVLSISGDSRVVLNAGERLALVGPTGCGKTTLLRRFCLLDGSYEAEVRFLGAAVQRGAEPAFRRQVLYVAQHALRAPISTEEHLAALFALKANRVHGEPSDLLSQARQLAQEFGKPALIGGARLDQLSGGENQILALIRALLMQPRVLLLDEPTSALDMDSRERAEKIISAHHRGEWVWVTHDELQAERIASRVVRLGHAE